MRIIQMSLIFVVSLLLAATSHVMASDFRCGSKTISIGDRQYDVLNKCGEPSHIDTRDEVRFKRYFWPGPLGTEMGWNQWQPLVKELVTIEEWEYNLGPTRFIRYLRFENGRLTRITDGDYGYYSGNH